ncbi:MAG TPA: hypothetical protein PLT82_10680 [Candidatus Hydrogenedens sp.]|nr:hypothetical protein [Candidatus Hydrogenedens sp.]HPP59586.1 hypothetical protein [Candidatus Hydrogenedens sp.]
MDKVIYWIPRILSVFFILFLAMFSLDIFEMNLDFWDTLLGLFMHNIPSIILSIILVISWKYEIVGGIAYILAGLLYIALLVKASITSGFQIYYLIWIVMISGPAFVVGFFFILCRFSKKGQLKSIKK